MKREQIISCLWLLLLFFTTGARAQNANAARIEFVSTTYNYDTIPQGSTGLCEFAYKNIGNEPLIITDVNASCGCTKPQWSKSPLMPGKTGKIVVKYNTQIIGAFRKNIVVHSNAANTPNVVLKVKGYVTTSRKQKD